MSPRGFLTFAIVTATALLAAITFVIVEQIAASGDRRSGGLMFAELADRAGEVSQVSIDARRYKIVVELRDGQWIAIDRGDYPVRSEPIDQLLAAMADLVEYEAKTTNPANYLRLGVAGQPSDGEDTRVTITSSDGEVLADAIIGYPASAIGRHTRGGMYIRRVDEELTWLAEGAALPPTFASEFFDPLFSIPGNTVGRLTILAGDAIIFDAEKVNFNTGDFDLVYLDPAIGPAGSTARDSRVRGMSQAIVSTTFLDARTIDAVTIPDDARTVRYETRDGLSLAATLAEGEGVTWVVYTVSAEPGSAAEQQAAAIAAATSGWVFLLQPSRIITFTREVTELFDPPVVAPEPVPGLPQPLIPVPIR